MNQYTSAAPFSVSYRSNPLPRGEWLQDFRGETIRVRLGDDVNGMDTVYRLRISRNRVVEQITEVGGVYRASLSGKFLAEIREMMQDYGEPPYYLSYDLVNRHRDYGNGHVVID